MLMRVFEFSATPIGRTDFRLSYEAFRGRDPAKCVKEERRHLAAMQRAFEAVSDPVGELADDADLDGRMRKLKAEGGTMRLPQKTFEHLETFIDETAFMAGVSMQVEDLKDRLSAAEKVEDSDADPATVHRPRAIRDRKVN